jgi:hypothetical protein
LSINVGGGDKLIRILAGLGMLSLIFLLQSNVRWIGLIGIVPLFIGLIGHCPLYSLFRLNTCPAKTEHA